MQKKPLHVVVCIGIAFAVAFPSICFAHIYQFTNTNPEFQSGPNMGKQLYIRVVRHPEMNGYFSYGLCEKIITNYQSAQPDHKHEKCITAPGKYWWLLHDFNKESIPDVPGRPTYLAELLQKDNNWYGGLQFVDLLTWVVGGATGAGIAAKVALKGFGKFALASAIDWAGNAAFWTGATSFSSKFNSDTYQATMPYTDYKNWSGQEDLILDASANSLISLDECIAQCLAEPEHKIVNKFFELLDQGVIQTQEERTPGSAYNIKDFGFDNVCELYCENQGHPEFAVPNIQQLWTLMVAILSSSKHEEFKRVAFDFDIQTWPWSEPEPKIQITYMTPDEIQRYRNSKDPRFKGECLIGSECDQKYPIRSAHPLSMSYKDYSKITLNNLLQNYPPSFANQWAVRPQEYLVDLYEIDGTFVTEKKLFTYSVDRYLIEQKTWAWLSEIFSSPGVYLVLVTPKIGKKEVFKVLYAPYISYPTLTNFKD